MRRGRAARVGAAVGAGEATSGAKAMSRNPRLSGEKRANVGLPVRLFGGGDGPLGTRGESTLGPIPS